MTDTTQQRPRPCALAMRIPGCDGLGPGSEAARLVEYLKGYPLTDGVSAAIRVLSEQVVEIERLTADRDSWMQQASDRAQDALDLVAAERERCAKMADEYATWGGSNFYAWFKKLAAAIRA